MKSKRILGMVLILVAVAGLVWSTKVSHTNPKLKTYSDVELKTFWANHLDEVFAKQIFYGRYRISEINDRYTEVSRMIEDRYHQTLKVNMVTTYAPESEWIAAGSQVKDGVPIVELIIPTLINIHAELVATYGAVQGEEFFEQNVVIGLMHELDHLAYGYIGTAGDSLDLVVEHERRTWALTCEHTIRPLVEKSGVVLNPSEGDYYSNWIRAGRNVDSPVWIQFIREAYAQTRK